MSILQIPDDMKIQVKHKGEDVITSKIKAIRMQRLSNFKKNLYNLSSIVDELVLDFDYGRNIPGAEGEKMLTPELLIDKYFNPKIFETVFLTDDQVKYIGDNVAAARAGLFEDGDNVAATKEVLHEMDGGAFQVIQEAEVTEEVTEEVTKKKKKKKKSIK